MVASAQASRHARRDGLTSTLPKTLLIGGYGQLGTAIRQHWTDAEIVAPTHAALDIENHESVEAALHSAGAALVVNCAAFHDVDRCEREPARAFAVNAYAVYDLARTCARHGAALLTFSTDYVFDGTLRRPYREEDAPHPLSAYAASKLAGEALAASANPRTYVVRTCGLYGHADRLAKASFIDRILESARRGEEIAIEDGVVASPTFVGHLAEALRSIVAGERYGLYHAVNRGPVSWLEFAAEAMRQSGMAALPRPGPPRPRVAPRPSYSALESARLDALGIELPEWREGIRAYLQNEA